MIGRVRSPTLDAKVILLFENFLIHFDLPLQVLDVLPVPFSGFLRGHPIPQSLLGLKLTFDYLFGFEIIKFMFRMWVEVVRFDVIIINILVSTYVVILTYSSQPNIEIFLSLSLYPPQRHNNYYITQHQHIQ